MVIPSNFDLPLAALLALTTGSVTSAASLALGRRGDPYVAPCGSSTCPVSDVAEVSDG